MCRLRVAWPRLGLPVAQGGGPHGPWSLLMGEVAARQVGSTAWLVCPECTSPGPSMAERKGGQPCLFL